MCHELEDEFIFGAFNVLWLDTTIDDASKTNASYPRSMKTFNLIEHPPVLVVCSAWEEVSDKWFSNRPFGKFLLARPRNERKVFCSSLLR